jgi:hypothetical protein
MAENKTKETTASVDDYFAAIEDPARRSDCMTIDMLMTKISKRPPKMWGPGIVGYGSIHYKYESGREGDICMIGFSSRKSDISVYLSGQFPEKEQLLAKLGKHKMGKGCLSIRTLSDVDTKILEQLIACSLKSLK